MLILDIDKPQSAIAIMLRHGAILTGRVQKNSTGNHGYSGTFTITCGADYSATAPPHRRVWACHISATSGRDRHKPIDSTTFTSLPQAAAFFVSFVGVANAREAILKYVRDNLPTDMAVYHHGRCIYNQPKG